MAFMVRARRPISSPVGGSGTRRVHGRSGDRVDLGPDGFDRPQGSSYEHESDRRDECDQCRQPDHQRSPKGLDAAGHLVDGSGAGDDEPAGARVDGAGLDLRGDLAAETRAQP